MVAWWFGGAVDGGYDEILRMLVAAYCRADLGHFLDDLGAFSQYLPPGALHHDQNAYLNSVATVEPSPIRLGTHSR